MKSEKSARPRLIGRGTIAMFAGILAFGAYNLITRPKTPQNAYFEADRTGRLVRLDRPSPERANPPKLWKTEPRLLLSERGILELSPAQVSRISNIVTSWDAAKTGIEERIQATTSTLSRSETLNLSGNGLATLGGYSELSREFDRRRSAAWSEAIEVLNERQRSKVAQLQAEAQK